MTPIRRDLVVKSHREEVERDVADAEEKKLLVEAVFEQAVVRLLHANPSVDTLEHAACDQSRQGLPSLAEEPKGVWYTELAEMKPGEPLADEWNTYCQEIGRLLDEGQEGRHVLVNGQQIIGTFDTSDAAYAEGQKRFPNRPFFVHPIRAEEPYLRIRGVNYPCPGSFSR
jgi:hypothetical protein